MLTDPQVWQVLSGAAMLGMALCTRLVLKEAQEK